MLLKFVPNLERKQRYSKIVVKGNRHTWSLEKLFNSWIGVENKKGERVVSAVIDEFSRFAWRIKQGNGKQNQGNQQSKKLATYFTKAVPEKNLQVSEKSLCWHHCKTRNLISSMLDENWNSNPSESLMKIQFKNRASQNPKPSSTPRWFSQRLFSVHTSNLAHMH